MIAVRTVLYSAAHGGFAGEITPLGGGAAVCDLLVEHWRRARPFPLELLSPSSLLGAEAPRARDLVSFGEREYARFCHAFERAATQEILRHDPASVVVLSNDIAEGPDFAELHSRGYRVFTIFHVDVVAYIAATYARGWLSPRKLGEIYDLLRPLPLPSIARLIFDKQWSAVEYSRGLIVPSSAMKTTLLDCYPALESESVHVVPWGVPDPPPFDAEAIADEVAALRLEYSVPADALVLLTLSRISREKGQHVLLEALLDWERLGDLPERPLWLFVSGEAAYMSGRGYEQRLRALASRLRKVRVVFPGHVTGLRKRAVLSMASIYVFPSRQESYGLTLLEAMQAGLPSVCWDHDGARDLMRPEFGAIVSTRGQLLDALEWLLNDEALRRECGEAARLFAQSQRFEDAAAKLAAIVQL